LKRSGENNEIHDLKRAESSDTRVEKCPRKKSLGNLLRLPIENKGVFNRKRRGKFLFSYSFFT